MILVSGYIRFMGICAGFLLAGRQMRVGWSTTAIFGDFAGYVFENFGDTASNDDMLPLVGRQISAK